MMYLLLCSHFYSAVAESVDLCVCVCTHPFISIMRISCFWRLCVYQISREDKTFFLALGNVEFLGETHTIPSAWREWSEWMNDLRAHIGYGPHKLSTTTTRGLLLFNFLPWNKEDILLSSSAWKLGERETHTHTTKQCSSPHHHHHVVLFIWSQVLKNALSSVNVLGEVLIRVCSPEGVLKPQENTWVWEPPLT